MKPGIKKWLYRNVGKIPLLNNGLLDPDVIPKDNSIYSEVRELSSKINNLTLKVNKVEIITSLSVPGTLGEIRIYEGELFAWLPDPNQVPVQDGWVSLSFNSIDGGVVVA